MLNLLAQVEGVTYLGRSRIFEAGLDRLDTLAKAKADELAAVAGLDVDVAGAVSATVSAYVAANGLTTSTLTPDAERAVLKDRVRALVDTQARFDKASSRWTKASLQEKRRLRRKRDVEFAKVQVTLARLGELRLIQELQRAPFGLRVSSLRTYAGVSDDASSRK